MLIKLSQIENLKIGNTKNISRAIRSNIFNAFACILSEYAISYLKMDISDDKVYPYIRNYFSGEYEAYKLIVKMLQNDEVKNRFNFIPDIENKQFDADKWVEILNNIYIDVDEKTTYIIFGDKYTVEKVFVNTIMVDNMFYLQKYFLCYNDKKQEYYFQTIGNENEQNVNKNPYIFGTLNNKKVDAKILNFSEEDFFKIEQMVDLNNEQKNSIKADIDKNLLVLAGAGSGKTRSLVSRLSYLHLVKNIPLNEIILLTFTTAAAESMRNKAEKLIKDIYYRFDFNEEPHVYAKTIDAFFLKLLLDHYAEFGFTNKPQLKIDKILRSDFLRNIINENNMQWLFKKNNDIKDIYSHMNDYASGINVFKTGYSKLFSFYLDKQIENNCLLDFTSINVLVKRAICNNNLSLKKFIIDRYSCILIDEFQDISALQYATFKPFYNSKLHFTFVGDDDQSIYGWRGADVSVIKKLAQNNNIDKKHLLINYRNNPNIVRAGNCVLKQIEDRTKSKETIPYKKSGDKIRVSTNDYRYSNIADEIKRMHDNGHKYKEFCILTRVNTEGVSEALKAIGIPVIISNIPIELNDYYYLLKALINIKSECELYKHFAFIKKKANVENLSDEDLYELINGNKYCDGYLQIIQIIYSKMFNKPGKELYKIAEKFSVIAAEEEEEFKKILEGSLDNRIIEAFIDYCRDCEIPWPVEHEQLKNFFMSFERKKNQKINPNNIFDAVTVSTIHHAKGLEYNIVMVLGLNSGEYPNIDKIDSEYKRNLQYLDQIKNARNEYNTYKTQISDETIKDLIKDTQEINIPEEIKEKIDIISEYITCHKNGLRLLKIEEIADYIDIFKTEVLSIEDRYKFQISKYNKIIADNKNEQSRIKEHVKLLENKLALIVDTTDVEENVNEIKKKIEEQNKSINGLSQIIEIEEKKLELVLTNYNIIRSKMLKIRQFYNVAIIVQGLLADMARENELEELKRKLEENMKNKVNEERRTFYVAITRAKDYLYLFTDENKPRSEFLDIIDNELKVDYKVMTKNEQDEFERLSNSLKFEFAGSEENINNENVSIKTNNILSSDLFKKSIDEKYKQFAINDPWCEELPGESKEFFKQGLCLQFVSELTGKPFLAELAHNLKRAAETILEISAGADVKPYITSNSEQITNISNRIRNVVREKGCDRIPSYKFIESIIAPSSNENQNIDRLNSLKNASIQHYIVRSNKFTIDKSTLDTWKNQKFEGDCDQFLKYAIDLANLRNLLEHPDKEEKWSEDLVSKLLNIFKEFFIINGVKSVKNVKDNNNTSLDYTSYSNNYNQLINNHYSFSEQVKSKPTIDEEFEVMEIKENVNKIKEGDKITFMKLGEGKISRIENSHLVVDFGNNVKSFRIKNGNILG